MVVTTRQGPGCRAVWAATATRSSSRSNGSGPEAAAWVARFDAGDVSAKDQAVFQEWLNRNTLRKKIHDLGVEMSRGRR